MVRAQGEQRNRYVGVPQRAFATVRLIDQKGHTIELCLMADTGCPVAIVVGEDVLQRMSHKAADDRETNYGAVLGGWVRVAIPEVRIDTLVLAGGSAVVVESVKSSSRTFDGLIGLPLLRMTEYGGDADFFWLREATR